MFRTSHAFAYGIIGLLTVFALFPLFWMVSSSLKSYADIYTFPPVYFPESISLQAYERVLTSTPFAMFFWNSLIVATASTFIGVALACMAGYSLSRARLRGREFLLKAILTAYLFPQILIVVPLFTAISALGLAGTYAGAIIAYITIIFPFSTWMMMAYFSKIPEEIEEAARIDGASSFHIFWRIVLPLAAPGVVTVLIFSFINAWNEFLLSLIILGGGERRTLPVGLFNFIGGEFAQWGEMMAATTMTMLPTLILFLIIQRRLVGGLTAGAVRG
ncbi:carbohydrate ABC transporter permease [Mesorhizobium sp. AD1-1]|uniref:carbohydrate ABC transporter permease n=1 Tax=Mesorhizobium sp. AD1-1 TaxID=2876621 RepID=UPI001CCD8AC2|nr:carbohydrate ABC transporter permease [Mesorhizobium sp. AD1-1]MBZ9719237.1 carbohydrate ABC transporter permease [Mesorhizobium sp. AD1-1]